MIGSTLDALINLLRGKVGMDQISGPIGIVSLTGEMVHYGVSFVARFVAMLAVNLAVLNLLPLPALDGGRMMLLSLKKGLKIQLKDEKIHYIGALLLIVLMIIVTYFDLKKFLMR